MFDCKFKSAGECDGRSRAGLGGVVHCLVCWLDKDRAAVAASLRRQEKATRQAAQRLERLREEFRVGG